MQANQFLIGTNHWARDPVYSQIVADVEIEKMSINAGINNV